MEKRFLTATDLMNHSYCPRIIYYVYVLKKPQFTTSKEYKGREKEGVFQKRAKITKVVKDQPKLPKMFKVHLESEKLGIRTIADSILIDESKNEAYPIQAKYSFTPQKLYRGQRFQVIMESMLIEECLGYNSPFGFIKFLRSNDLIKVNTENNREEVMESFQSITNIMSTEVFPKPTKYRKRCIDCCFKNFCWG